MKARLLIIEDEDTLREMLELNFSLEGYEVAVANNGMIGLEKWRTWQPDLVLLDVMMPLLSGFEVCQTMRAEKSRIPVIFLSAKSQAEDKVQGLQLGADDYITKPFHLPELLLRIENTLRRAAWYAQSLDRLEFGGHCIDFRAYSATLANGQTENLGEREMMILKLLAEQAGQVVSRDQILDAVWGETTFPSTRTIDNFVVRLRKLFEPQPSRPRYLHTIWGVGYKFTP
jgi:two-component system, OmpR family, alkaline phosphatase synthesis response regulator PhoP